MSATSDLGYQPPAVPLDEETRLHSLRELKLLDTEPEERFDRVVKLAAAVFQVPIAYIALVDRDRQWFKAQTGMCATQTSRDVSFCGHAILQDAPLVIPDAKKDPRFAGNPMVTGDPFVRFYAGLPVEAPQGGKVGTLCLVDHEPRELNDKDLKVLRQLGDLVEHEFGLFDLITAQDDLIRVKEELLESKREVERLFSDLSAEKAKTDRLLLNILPERIAEELKERGAVKAERHECACVLFADFTNFTAESEKYTPEDLVTELNECFTEFDDIVTRHGIEKLKTLGDGYLCAGGLVCADGSQHVELLRVAFEICDFISRRRKEKDGMYWDVRVGIHAGPLVAGVVGKSKFAYDIWGDTVNTASRMESASEPGRVNVSGAFEELVRDHADCESRGDLPVKGKETMEMFFVRRLR